MLDLPVSILAYQEKLFTKWFNRFKDNGYDVKELENQSRAPHRRRKWEVSLEQETKVKTVEKEVYALRQDKTQSFI